MRAPPRVPVALVNQAAAELLWPDADPLGHEFTLGTSLGQGGPQAGGTVIGVTGDVRDFGPARPARPRLYLVLLGIFAGVAVLLAALGIYGVLAHSVSQRTREIGIRLALGAPRGRVVGSVVAQAGGLALGGLGAGLLLAAGTGRMIRGLLFGVVQPIDTLTYALVAAGLAAVALLAALLPARRAASVDPVIALRHE